jgi:predicted metalloprotease
MAHVGRGEATGLTLGPKDLTSSLSGMISYADPVGVTADEQGAHGSGFDRVGAFQDGFANGAAKCATYPDHPPRVIELPVTQGDAATGGNLPYDKVVPFMGGDLDRFWSDLFTTLGKPYVALLDSVKKYADAGPYPSCGGDASSASFKGRAVVYCAAGDYVAYDDDVLQQINDIGDFAVGVFLGGAWAEAMQTRLGKTVTGAARSLQQDCYTGAWAGTIIPNGSVTPPTRQLTLSAGDLDEGVIAYIASGAYRDVPGQPAIAPFDRVASFRMGILDGAKACG